MQSGGRSCLLPGLHPGYECSPLPLAGEGADIVLNGLGDKTEIETTRGRLADEFGVRAIYQGADVQRFINWFAALEVGVLRG